MGSETFRNELSSQEIIDYAIFKCNNNDEDIINLTCEYIENIDQVD